MSDPSATDAKRFRVSRLLVLSGWILLLTLAVGIVAASIVAMLRGIENETLTNWGSAVMGFVFGTFPAMVRDFAQLRDRE